MRERVIERASNFYSIITKKKCHVVKFLIIYATLVLLLTRHLRRLKITGKKLYGGLQCTMRMTRDKNEEKI